MPWKGEKDPYKIWISEIILQQTRVLQGILYYNKFIDKFPTLAVLAAASDSEVYKIWEGLGYYSRCKNLLFTARHIVATLNGRFPETYTDLLKLKGVGPYTAAAIASFAYGLPHAVVDGNVFRVLSRYFDNDTPVDSTTGKSVFSTLASQMLYLPDPAAYNQAIMDFGATICKPQIPLCQLCVLQSRCKAFETGSANRLPVKEKQLIKRNRWFNYFIFFINDQVLVRQRPAGDIWENLNEFYLLESERHIHWNPQNVSDWLQQQPGVKQSHNIAISPHLNKCLHIKSFTQTIYR